MKPSRQEIIEKLVTDWGYKGNQVGEVVDKLMIMHPSIVTSFEHWFQTGTLLDEPVFSNLSPKTALEIFNLKPPAIFLLLDWIQRDPAEALNALSDEYHLTLPIREHKLAKQESTGHSA